jgi:hypothetical protein
MNGVHPMNFTSSIRKNRGKKQGNASRNKSTESIARDVLCEVEKRFDERQREAFNDGGIKRYKNEYEAYLDLCKVIASCCHYYKDAIYILDMVFRYSQLHKNNPRKWGEEYRAKITDAALKFARR